MDKAELLRTITTAQNQLSDLVGRISDDRLSCPATDDWTGKDLLAHVAWWQEHSARLTEDVIENREPDNTTHPGNTTDEINEYVYRTHRDDSPKVARDAFDHTFQRILAALQPLNDDDLFSTVRCPWLEGGALAEMLLSDTSRHYEQHFGHFEALIQEKSG